MADDTAIISDQCKARDETDSGSVSPEYRTLRKSYSLVLDIVKLHLSAISDGLFQSGYISDNLHEYTDTDGIPQEQKSCKMLDKFLNVVKSTPVAYDGFLKILRSSSSSFPAADDVIGHLDRCYEQECAATQIRPAEEMLTENSSEELMPDPSSVSPLPLLATSDEQEQVSLPYNEGTFLYVIIIYPLPYHMNPGRVHI